MIANQTQPKTKFRPPEVGRRYGVDPAKVIGWINNGELRAVNIAAKRGGRPRWIIDAADLAAFEESRVAKPPVKSSRQPRSSGRTKVFFT